MFNKPTNSSFPKARRLNEPAAFRWVFEKPLKLQGQAVSFFVRPNQLGCPRLGLAVTKKHIRKAVNRNRLRRQIRESFRLALPKLPGVDVVVFVKKGAEQFNRRVLQEELLQKWLTLRNFQPE